MAIDDNTTYGLTGAQVKDLANRVNSAGGATVHTVELSAYDTVNDVSIVITAIPKISFIPVLEENSVAVTIEDVVTWFNNGEEVIIKASDHTAKVISASVDEEIGSAFTFTIAVNGQGDAFANAYASNAPQTSSCGAPYLVDFIFNDFANFEMAIPHLPGKYTILAPLIDPANATMSWTIDFNNISSTAWYVGVPSYDEFPSWAVPAAVPSGSRALSAAGFLMMVYMSGASLEIAAINMTPSSVYTTLVPYVTAVSCGGSITNSSGNIMPIFSSMNQTPQVQYMPFHNFSNLMTRTGIWPVMATAITGSAYFQVNLYFMYRQSQGSSPRFGTLYAQALNNGTDAYVGWDSILK